MNIINNKKEAKAFLDKYIPKTREFKFPGEIGLKREEYLLKELGSPQNKLKVIHIAGTSGKGSTAYLTSVLLSSLGFKVGLSLSPTLIDIKERFQINNEFITDQEYCDYLSDLVPVVEKMSVKDVRRPTHFEIMVALTYYIFFKKKVDYAVIETGLGGLFDGTNVVTNPNKVAVITQIGFDHMHILGNTLSKIAFQKAGIIHKKNIVITLNQHPNALDVIKKSALDMKSKFYLLTKNNVNKLRLTPKPTFNFRYLDTEIKDVTLGMLGSFQVQNCSLALATLIILSKRDHFSVDNEKIKKALGNALFLGRMQYLTINTQTVIIDGAHNPQKMKMFVKNLLYYLPKRKFVFMISLRRGKNYKSILKYIVPVAIKVYIAPFASQTRVQGFSALAEDTKRIAKIFRELNYKNYEVCTTSQDAKDKVLQHSKEVGVITGSLYLLSEVYPTLTREVAKSTG